MTQALIARGWGQKMNGRQGEFFGWGLFSLPHYLNQTILMTQMYQCYLNIPILSLCDLNCTIVTTMKNKSEEKGILSFSLLKKKMLLGHQPTNQEMGHPIVILWARILEIQQSTGFA